MSDFPFEHELEVRFRDCDPLGHVNNAVYLTYLEAARFAWWRKTFGPDGLREYGFILARVEIDYRHAALPGQRLLVRLRVSAIGRSSFTVEYEIVAGSGGELVARARSVQVAYDYEQGRSVPLAPVVRTRLEAAMIVPNPNP
jgi:acyl-CoA thioester hydrolase